MLCVPFWFMKKRRAAHTHSPHIHNSCLTSRLNWIVISANSSAGGRRHLRQWKRRTTMVVKRVLLCSGVGGEGWEVNKTSQSVHESLEIYFPPQSEKRERSPSVQTMMKWKKFSTWSSHLPRINQIVSIFCNRFSAKTMRRLLRNSARRLMW